MKKQNSLSQAALLMLVTRFIINTLGIVSSLILVRVLSPEDFGITAIAMSIYAFISLFGEFGFSTALIHKNKLIKSDYDTVFSINLLFGFIAGTTMFLSSSSLANFFSDYRLEPVFQALAFLFIVNGFKNIKAVDFQINMQFKQEMKLQVIPKIITFIMTLSLAFYLESYWALVLAIVIGTLINILFSYAMIPYRPSLTFAGGLGLFNYSKWLMLNNFFTYLNNKSIDLIVGKFISTSAAGLYSISKEMATLPSSEIAAPINKAAFPAYSKEKDNPSGLRDLFYKTTAMITIIALPASLGLFITAEYFVPVVLGDQWIEAIPVVQLLSIYAFVNSISSNNGYIFLAVGKPQITTLISCIRIVSFFIFLFVFDLLNSIEEPALALVYSATINMLFAYILLKKEINISFIKLCSVNGRALLSALLMCVLVFLAKQYLNLDVSLMSFLTLVGTGAVFYSISVTLFWIISGRPESVEKQIISRIIRILRK